MTARCPRCGEQVPLVVVELLFDPGHAFTVLARHTREESSFYPGDASGKPLRVVRQIRCEGSREEVVEGVAS